MEKKKDVTKGKIQIFQLVKTIKSARALQREKNTRKLRKH